MPTSQNGWPANDRALVSSRLVPGTNVRLTVRNGPAGDLLLDFAARFDRDVEDIDNARGALDDWGYAERPIRGSATELSNHASGTAIDLNATRHPLGRRATFTPAQVRAIHRILAGYDGVLRWGGDYQGRVDEMHVEVNADAGRVAAVAARVLSQPPSTEEAFMAALTADEQRQVYDVIAQAYARTQRGLGDLLADIWELLKLPDEMPPEQHPGNLGNAAASTWRQTFHSTDYGPALVEQLAALRRDLADLREHITKA